MWLQLSFGSKSVFTTNVACYIHFSLRLKSELYYRSGRQIEDFGSYLVRDTLLLTKLIKICVIYIDYFDRVIK